MDSTTLNQVGIVIELVGTLLAAPELIDRFIGLRRVEGFLGRLAEHVGGLANTYLGVYVARSPSPTIMIAAGLTMTLLEDIVLTWALLVVFVDASRDFGDLGWWWLLWVAGSFFALVYLLQIIAAMVVGWRRMRKPWQRLLMILGTLPSRPFSLLYWHLALVAIAARPVASLVSRRLSGGWARTASLVVGASLFVGGLALQFVATL